MSFCGKTAITTFQLIQNATSLPYFEVKLSCVCLIFTYRKNRVTYSDPKVTYSDPKVTHSDPTHLPLPPAASPGHNLTNS